MDKNRFRFVALVLLACLGLLGAARAAVRFDVFPGYDGIVPEASWFPFVFEVANDGPGFNAVIEVVPSQFDSSQSRSIAVELPTGTTKRMVIPVFSSARYLQEWDARLLDEKGRKHAELTGIRARKLHSWRIPLAAGITRAALPLPEIKMRNAGDLQPVIARIQPNVFPDNPLALEGLDTIYLSSEKALDLNHSQATALMGWLHHGGHLIVGVEQITQINGNDWLRKLLPCDLASMTMLQRHSALHQWLRSNQRHDGRDLTTRDVDMPNLRRSSSRSDIKNPYAELEPDQEFESAPLQTAVGKIRDGKVLIGDESNPLGIIARRGRGQITVLMFSPELEPFLSWRNRSPFWAKMTALPPEMLSSEQYNQATGPSIDGVFGAMIDSRQVRKLPVGWLLLLLLAYLVVIGPLDYYWLKKVNRQMLTWITFPIYVALFSLLIYFIGYKLRAGETEWNELHLVDVLPVADTSELRGRTYSSIYSPINATYRLVSDLPFATLRGEFLGNYATAQEGSRANVQQRGNSFIADVSVPVWTSQLFVSDWINREDLPLKMSVKRETREWVVDVENLSDQKITLAELVLDGQVFDLGELPKEQKRTFRFTSGTPISNFVQAHGSSFMSAITERQRAFSENRIYIHDVARASMAASLVSYLSPRPDQGYGTFVSPPGLDLSSFALRGDAILLAWAPNHSPIKSMNKFSARRSSRNTLFRLTLPMGS
jgi:hypothetical protein